MLAVTIALSVLMLGAGPAAAQRLVMPMPGERFVTPAERAAVRAAMTPAEAEAVGHLFNDAAPELVVGYAKQAFEIVEGDDGLLVPYPVGPATSSGVAAISLPVQLVAASDTQSVAGTDLYISMTTARTTSSSPYKWQTMIYSEWRGTGGMGNRGNTSKDHMSVAWSGIPAYVSSSWISRYSGAKCPTSSMNVVRGQVRSYGTTFSFNEWANADCRAYYALMYVNMQETTWQNRSGTVAYDYNHTFTGLSYTISLSRTPSISISPTSSQWVAGVGVVYSY